MTSSAMQGDRQECTMGCTSSPWQSVQTCQLQARASSVMSFLPNDTDQMTRLRADPTWAKFC